MELDGNEWLTEVVDLLATAFSVPKGKTGCSYPLISYPHISKRNLIIIAAVIIILIIMAGHCWARRSWPRRVAWFSAQFSNTWETCPPGHPLHSTYNLDFTTWSMKISKHKTSYLKHTTKNMFGSVFLGTTCNCSCVSAFHPLSLKFEL